jgi:hypothetical protein
LDEPRRRTALNLDSRRARELLPQRVRDYKAAADGDPSRLGTASPFNLKLESLRLGDFIPAESTVRLLETVGGARDLVPGGLVRRGGG